MRTRVRAAAVLAFLFLGFQAAAADVRSVTYSLDIPAQNLNDALQALAIASQHKLLYSSELVDGKSAPAIKGTYTTEQAVRQLLTGTNLTYEIDDGLVLIRSKDDKQPLPIAGHERKATSGPLRLSLAQGEEGKSEGGENTKNPESNKDSQGTLEELEEIVVTGTHIRGVRVLATPLIQTTRQEFSKTGYSTLEQFFDNLPQNFSEISYDGALALEGGSALARTNTVSATGIDLRGLGAQSTLTLLNGTRRAGSLQGQIVDISAIPLSIIERVEVVTGGRSAIYGADAVAGVVNIVTRREFQGAETQAYYGMSSEHDGGERTQFSQIIGADFGRGGVVAAYDYAQDKHLDLVDTGLVVSPVFDIEQHRIDISPDLERHSAFLSGRFALNGRIELRGDGIYTRKDSESRQVTLEPGASNESFNIDENTSEQHSVSLGAGIDLSNAWLLNLTATSSAVTDDNPNERFQDFGDGFPFTSEVAFVSKTRLSTASALVNGTLPQFAEIQPRLALGVEARREKLLFFDRLSGDVFNDRTRTVRSAFAETLIPFANDGSRGLRRLDLTLAARYDDYSDIGSRVVPQADLVWSPIGGVSVRAGYAEAFRAPALRELGNRADAFIFRRFDPSTGGNTPVLYLSGGRNELAPEEAKTWSFGIDYEPAFVPNTRLSLSYFDVDYQERLDIPAIGADFNQVLERESRFPDLIDRDPTAEEIEAIRQLDFDRAIGNFSGLPWNPATQEVLEAFPNLVTFDNRRSNIAVETARGVDLTFSGTIDAAIGAVDLGLNATYTFDHDRQVTATSPAFSLLNEIGKPVDLRVRANAGIRRGGFGAYAYVNYVDHYSNPFATPVGRMESWTTVDPVLQYDGSARDGFMRDVSVTLSVDNLFDTDPPEFLDGFAGLRYDATNASAVGRFIALRIRKAW